MRKTSGAGNTRELTPTQRREYFLKLKGSIKEDWKILTGNSEETLTPYGFLTLDYVLKLKGIASRGRVIQIHGNEFAGKSTLTYCLNRNYQKATGEPVAIFDHERTVTSKYLRSIGVDEDMALIYFPDSIEEAAKMAIEAMENGVRLFTFDSIPRMKPRVDSKLIKNGEAFNPSIGKHARAIQDFYDNLLPHAAEHDCTFLMVNQVRARIEAGMEASLAAKYPSMTNLPYTLPGGKSARFVPSTMIELQTKKAFRAGGGKDDFLFEPGDNKGPFIVTQVRARALKNKVTDGGFREGTLWLRPGQGMDENISIRELARQFNLIDYSGRRWFVGANADEAIIVYNNKEEAIRDLVIDQNPKVLEPLRELVVKTIEQDQSSRFNLQLEEGEDTNKLATYLKGEDETPFDIEDED